MVAVRTDIAGLNPEYKLTYMCDLGRLTWFLRVSVFYLLDNPMDLTGLF